MKNEWKRDIVEDAQIVLNQDSTLKHKGLVSMMANEIVALRAEVDNLESQLNKVREVLNEKPLLIEPRSYYD